MRNVLLPVLLVALSLSLAGMSLAASDQDLQLAERIQQRLALDKQLKSDRILVQTDDGDVRLLGTVDTTDMKQAAMGAAMSVAGVRRIDNQLAVSGEPPTDPQLEAAVMDALHRSTLTADSLIVAHAAKGDITLEGAVSSELARREATRLAQTVLGVRSIRNHLSIPNTQTAVVPPAY